MKKRNLKVISFVMSVLLTLLVFPLGTIAYALENRYETLNEVVELRDENTKHFENPDGSYTAIMYNNAVHRKDSNGNWQDIDNTMSETEIKNKQAYITSDGRITFAKKIKQDENEIYTLSENGYRITVSFANKNIKSSNAKLSNHASKYTPSGRDDLDTQFKKVKQIDNNTTLLYKNTLKGIDLEYVLSSNNVKENIIVKRLQDEYSYTFIYSLENLVATLNEDGSVSLFDSESGEQRYSIPVPYMYDANGNLSYDVEYSLESLENGDYALTVTASSDWINSAKLPVVIDPTTVTTVSNSACVYDTYIDVNNPNTNYGNNRNMYVSSSQMVYMRPISLPTIPDDATVFYATLNIYYYYPSAVPEDGVELDVYPVVVPWSENTWTYSMASQYESFGFENRDVGYAYLPESYSSSQDYPEFAPIDITGIFVNAYAGEPFYGMALKYLSDEYPSYISILSGETYLTTYSTYDLYYQRDAVLENGIYVFENVNSKAVMGLAGYDHNSEGLHAYMAILTAASDQLWHVEYLHNGYYKITSNESGKALSVISDRVQQNNALILQETYQNLERQQWDFISIGNGRFEISPRSNSSARLSENNYNVVQNTRNVTNSERWKLRTYLPPSGYELDYEPELWNYYPVQNCNCYSYAINNQFDATGESLLFMQQPGQYAGNYSADEPLWFGSLEEAVAYFTGMVRNDFDAYNEINDTDLTFMHIGRRSVCPEGTYKIALVINPDDYTDYHWYRQDYDGFWSHKPGITEATNLDFSDNRILDPQEADRGDWTIFVGYFAVTPWNNIS